MHKTHLHLVLDSVRSIVFSAAVPAVVRVVGTAHKDRVTRCAWIVVLSVVLTFFSDSLCAQVAVLIGNNIDVSSGLTLQRGSPSVAYNSANNEYLIVWFDLRNQPTTGNDVFGQRVSADGSLLGGNIPIAIEIGSQSAPFVSYNSIDNNYLVDWMSQFDGPGSPDFNDAFGRLVSNAGIPLGGPFHISDGGLEISSAYNPTNNEYLVTGRVFASGPVPGIFGQIVSNGGSLVGGGIVISTVAPAPNGQVIYNPTINEYFATWRDQVDENLKGHRISATGVLIGTPILISPLFPEGSNPTASIAFDPANNRYLIVFASFQGTEIWGQFVSSSGGLIGSNFLIQTVSSRIEPPSLAHSSIDNVFFLVWRDGNDVIGQLLSETGGVLGSPLIIANGTAGLGFVGAHPPTTVHNTTTGDFLVVWRDNRNVPQGEQDIFAQLVGISTGQITDKTPPDILGMPSANCTLWPPNHQLVQVAIVAATDAESGIAPGSFNVTGSSNEPLDPRKPDIVITPNASGALVVQLGAERSGAGKGRVYTLTASAEDRAGNRVTATSTCLVPHDQGR